MKKIIAGISAILVVCSIGIGINVNAAKPLTAVSNVATEYYFPRAGQKPEPVLVSVISSAKSSLDIAIYSITDTNIANAIIADKKRGVTVRVISDKTESAGKYQKALLNTLKSAGIPVKINSHAGLMHMKITIADKSIATTGSFNYSKAAETENDEVFVVLRNTVVAKDFDSEFATMWADTKDYKSY